MIQPEEQKMLDFVATIPHNVNPYFAVATYLEREAKPVVLPPWVQIVMGVIIGGYFMHVPFSAAKYGTYPEDLYIFDLFLHSECFSNACICFTSESSRGLLGSIPPQDVNKFP
ncbi:uncharacterized protein MELLADRAFT_112974 [Melampsora larici-populina 98AG31]|uniref:Uncharacterized protein n=1 Tax=Melampsora larici-populina (strain 98AG31 / pathotype 3-4-7) TaxID=747676 RepID=F4S8A6_MELLP|nr:uncharacterized protein MELLADRAFT_112974 [Melampsora larici-populina 98AG31]EGF99121.1 hypothetical protein MELLADRAFT_112974 [Melampsora larici-populina 98AG31]